MSEFDRWEISDQTIAVDLVPEPGQPPVERWSGTLLGQADPAAIPFDKMETLVAAMRPDDAPPPPHFIDFRRGYTEWGASAAAHQIVLTLAEWATAGVVGNLIYESLKRGVLALVLRARDAARNRGEVVPTPPLSHDEALERARWYCANKWSIGHEAMDQLALVGEVSDTSVASWIFHFKYAGRLYEVEVVDEDGLVLVARTGWKHH